MSWDRPIKSGKLGRHRVPDISGIGVDKQPGATGTPAALLEGGLVEDEFDDGVDVMRLTISSSSSGHCPSLEASFEMSLHQNKPLYMSITSEKDEDDESIAALPTPRDTSLRCSPRSDFSVDADPFLPKRDRRRIRSAVTAPNVPALRLQLDPFHARSEAQPRSPTDRFSPSPRKPAWPDWSSMRSDTEPSLQSSGKDTDLALQTQPLVHSTPRGMTPRVANVPMVACDRSTQDSLAPMPTHALETSRLHPAEADLDNTRPVHRNRLGHGADGWFAELQKLKDTASAETSATLPQDPPQVLSNVRELQEALSKEREKNADLQRRVNESEAISKWLQGELNRIQKTEALAGTNKVDRLAAVQKASTTTAPPEQVEKLHRQELATDFKMRRLENVVEHQAKEIERLNSTVVTSHLEEEVMLLRADGVRVRQDLVVSRTNEKALRKQVERLTRHKLDESSSMLHQCKVETREKVPVSELEHLAATMSGQLVAVEQELSIKMRERAELVEPFVKKMHKLLARALRAADDLEKAAGRQPNSLFHLKRLADGGRDLKVYLVSIVEALRYSVDCIERASQQHGRKSDATCSP